MPTSPADGIRKLGFRRWYERQLIESHAWFITCFLCMILLMACMEGYDPRDIDLQSLQRGILIFAAGILGLLALKRYKVQLERAEYVAERSTCAICSTYGRLEILGAGGTDGQEIRDGLWMRVACRKCGHRWLIE